MIIAAEPWTRADYLSLVGILVSVAGFLFAAVQLLRTARATEATRDGIRASSRHQLLLMLPQFKIFEVELDFALQGEDREHRSRAARTLGGCFHLANEIGGLLREHRDAFPAADDELIAQLADIASKASLAKDEIYNSPNKKLVNVTRDFREAYRTGMQLITHLQMSGPPSLQPT